MPNGAPPASGRKEKCQRLNQHAVFTNPDRMELTDPSENLWTLCELPLEARTRWSVKKRGVFHTDCTWAHSHAVAMAPAVDSPWRPAVAVAAVAAVATINTHIFVSVFHTNSLAYLPGTSAVDRDCDCALSTSNTQNCQLECTRNSMLKGIP